MSKRPPHRQGPIPLRRLTINEFTKEEEAEILRRAKEPGRRIDNLGEFFRKLK